MKVQSGSKFDQKREARDITEVFIELQDKYTHVFIQKIENELLIYRALGRSEYKKILDDDRFNDMQKEELICQVCTLWPEDYDFDNCDAGIPTVLTKEILKNSYLDSINSRKAVLDYHRQEMHDLDNQITCIINEAFPQIDIEEIESWGVEKTTKYLSRAEWKLHNLRGMEFYDTDSQESYYEKQNEAPARREAITEELGEEEKKNIRGGKKEKLTPEKLAEMKAKFPEINWDADSVAQEGIAAMQDSVDTLSPALRPGGY